MRRGSSNPEKPAGFVPPRTGLLVPVGAADPAWLEFLSFVLAESTGLEFRVADRAVPIDDAYDAVRRQWNAMKILGSLDESEERHADRVLGIAEVDLFIPILTFVFGLAHLGARAGLVSVHRLRSEFYGLPPDPELLLSRLEKEAVHEIGHTLRLVHCPDYNCVMHYSNAVEEVDLKGAAFCPECRRKAEIG